MASVATNKLSPFNITALTLGLAFLYLPIAAALRRLDPALEDAAAALGLGHVPLADGYCRPNAVLEESLVNLIPFGAQHPHADLGLRIENPHAQKPLAMVLDLHGLAIGRLVRQSQDGTLINPGMPRDDAVGLARFQQNGR